MKDTEDLQPEPGSIGGAMSKWPRRTTAWTCRLTRTGEYMAGVVDALQAENVKSLRNLIVFAEDNGIDATELRQVTETLDNADPDDMERAVRQAYAAEYGQREKCPYEREGNDMACHRCPVPSKSIDHMREGDT